MAVNHYARLADGVDTTVLDLARRHQEGRVSEDDTTVTFRFADRDYSPAPECRGRSDAAPGSLGLLRGHSEGAGVSNDTAAGTCCKCNTWGRCTILYTSGAGLAVKNLTP